MNQARSTISRARPLLVTVGGEPSCVRNSNDRHEAFCLVPFLSPKKSSSIVSVLGSDCYILPRLEQARTHQRLTHGRMTPLRLLRRSPHASLFCHRKPPLKRKRGSWTPAKTRTTVHYYMKRNCYYVIFGRWKTAPVTKKGRSAMGTVRKNRQEE